MTSLSIILLTHNRTEQAFEAIVSILNQTNHNFELIVSDNSETSSLGDLIQTNMGNFPLLSNVRYIKHAQVLPALEHVNLCLDEIRSGYFCLFHDDDLMLPNFVAEFFDAHKLYPNAVAFGANAITEKNGIIGKPFFESIGRYFPGINSKVLATRYFARHQLGVAPFPSYIYNQSIIRGLYFDPSWGKYGDVTWLLTVARRGEIVWINQALMVYRLHDGNDSLTESRRDRLKFLGFLKKNINEFGSGLLSDYRFFIYKKNLPILLGNQEKSKRGAILKKYMATYRILRWFRLDHHGYLINKLCIRLSLKYAQLIRYYG